jgi:tetratricopeptide (TPR) repeat protein
MPQDKNLSQHLSICLNIPNLQDTIPMTQVAASDKTFTERLKEVLKWFDNPQRIGVESPLASPYFLSRRLPASRSSSDAGVRGRVLCEAIVQAAEQLWGDQPPCNRETLLQAIQQVRQQPTTPRYAYIVLELRCFQRIYTLRRPDDIWEKEEFLPGSRAAHYRDFDHAVQWLAQTLIEQLQPPSIPEAIPLPPFQVGYEEQQAQLQAALQGRQSVALTGSSGIGKSSLAATIIQGMPPRTCLWFTIRPGLNDTFSSLLFALGHFLHCHGSSNLWQHVIANRGNIAERELLLSLLRADLAQVDRMSLVVCIDELERLTEAYPNNNNFQHRLLLEFLESLRGQITLLFISQLPILETDVHIELSGLTLAHLYLWWRHEGQPIRTNQANELYQTTQGNPRLLKLCLTLQQAGESFIDILAQLAYEPTILPIFRRIWDRLTAMERQLLQRLAVARRPLPDHLWDQVTLQQLIQRRLVEQVEVGRIQTMPVLTPLLYALLDAETRHQFHLAEALIRSDFAEYTEAAWHYQQAGADDLAVQLWYLHREQEILRGHAEAALSIFAAMNRDQLESAKRRGFDLIYAELCRLRGSIQEGFHGLTRVDWLDQSRLAVRIHELRGQFLEAMQEQDSALDSYTQGITIIAQLLRHRLDLYHRRSLIHLNHRAIQQARQEARLGECTLLILQGQLAEVTGQYQDALFAGEQALTIANRLGDELQIIDASRLLAEVYGLRLEQFEKALPYFELAIQTYERRGDHLNAARTRNNLAATMLKHQQWAVAFETAQDAYKFLKAARDELYIASTAINLAEAAFEMGDLAMALQYAYEALDAEDDYVYLYAHFELGRIKQAQGDLAVAEAHLAESLRFARQYEDKNRIAYALRELGRCHSAMNRASEAEAEIREALRLFEEMQLTQEAIRTRTLLLH